MEFPFGSWAVTEKNVVDFARVYDPLPLHTDPEGAAAGPLGGLIASGLQTMSIYQALAVEALWQRIAVQVGRGLTARLTRPVRPGMTLTGKATITDLVFRVERGDAVLALRAELVEDAGHVVCEIDADAVVLTRPRA